LKNSLRSHKNRLAITDLIGPKSIESEALAATLDTVAAGGIIVADENRIPYAVAGRPRWQWEPLTRYP